MKLSFFGWLGNFAIFYIIILAMLGIPVIAMFIVLGLKTLFAWRYWITGGIILSVCILLFVLYRRRKKYKQALHRGSKQLEEILKMAIKSGKDVDISVMGGLVKISCTASQAKNTRNVLPGQTEKIYMLADPNFSEDKKIGEYDSEDDINRASVQS
jgi:membrane protein implicated in regulation of membrane protease activity